MIVTQQIQVELTDKQERPSIDAVQGDGAKAVKISLLAQGEAWPIPAGAAALIRYRKLDGTGGSYDTMPDGAAAYSIDGSAITVRLAPETMTDSGVTQVQVVLRKDGAELAAFTMNLSVEPDPSIDTMDSADFVNHSIQMRRLFDDLYGQTFNADGYLGQKVDALHRRLEPGFVIGGISPEDGTNREDETCIRSGYYLHSGRPMTATFPQGVTVRFFFYDLAHNYMGCSEPLDAPQTLTNPAPVARCVAAYADGTPIADPAALAEKVGIFYPPEELQADLELSRSLCHPVEPEFFPGTVDETGTPDESSPVCLYSEPIHVGRQDFTVALAPTVRVRYAVYDAEGAYVGNSGWKTESFHAKSAYPTLRLVISYADQRKITDADALKKLVIFYFPADSHHSYRGNVLALGRSTFAECKEDGYYSFAKNDIPSITDAPENLVNGGILEVFRYGADQQVFQFLRNVKGDTWFRWGSNPFRSTAGMESEAALAATKSLSMAQAPAFRIGTLDGNGDADESQTACMYSSPISLNRRGFAVAFPDSVIVRYSTYNETGFQGDSGWKTGSFRASSINPTLRLVVRYADGRTIEDMEALAKLVTFYFPADSHTSYRGNVPALGHTAFAACKEDGYYSFSKADVPSISDAPEGLENGGILEVYKYGADNVVFQFIRNIKGDTWFRWGSNPFQKAGGNGADMKWIALGDSITEGYYGYFDENDAHGYGAWFNLDETNCWANLTARYNGWNLKNLGIGGSGFVAVGTNDQRSGRELVAATDFSGTDLVTMMYGINDWKYGHPLGTFADDLSAGGTFISNMRWCIEKILVDNPHAKIVVISPINAWRQNNVHFGDEAGNWAMGHIISENGCTLEDFFQAEQEICRYYGLEFVDMLHGSVVNRKNIGTVLPDGLHPSLDCHRMLAMELSRKIMAGDPAPQGLMEKIETRTTDGTQKQLSLTGLGLRAFRLCVEAPAGAASSTVYADVYTLEGEQAASCYIGNGINSAGARCFKIIGDTDHGLSDVRFTLAAASGLTGVNIQTQPKTVQTRGYNKIILTASSTVFPAGTTITLWGIWR